MEKEIRYVNCGGNTLEYCLTRKNVKNVNMRIKPDGTVNISASKRVPIKYIEDFIRSRYAFIVSSFEKMRAAEDPSRAEPDLEALHDAGDVFLYLGKEYRLEVVRGEEDSVSLRGDILSVTTCDTENAAYISKMLRGWYYNRTAELFRRLNAETHALFKEKYGLPPAKVRIRAMKSQWGSCHINDGVIVMNSRLIFYPENSVRYVFIHEYAHFIVPDHSERFYSEVSEFMPDYRIWRGKLK